MTWRRRRAETGPLGFPTRGPGAPQGSGRAVTWSDPGPDDGMYGAMRAPTLRRRPWARLLLALPAAALGAAAAVALATSSNNSSSGTAVIGPTSSQLAANNLVNAMAPVAAPVRALQVELVAPNAATVTEAHRAAAALQKAGRMLGEESWPVSVRSQVATLRAQVEATAQMLTALRGKDAVQSLTSGWDSRFERTVAQWSGAALTVGKELGIRGATSSG